MALPRTTAGCPCTGRTTDAATTLKGTTMPEDFRVLIVDDDFHVAKLHAAYVDSVAGSWRWRRWYGVAGAADDP